MIINEPEPVKVLDYGIMATMKEYKPIINGLRHQYMSVKEIHQLYYNEKEKKYERGLKTIYRYIERLIEEGLVIEVGQRMTQGSRTVETLYGPAAKVFFYEGPQIMEMWKSEHGQKSLETMNLLVSKLIGEPIPSEDFNQFAMEFLTQQDERSSQLLDLIKTDNEALNTIRTIPSNELGKLIFLATDLSLLWERSKS